MSGITRPASVRAADLKVGLDQVRFVELSAAKAWPATSTTALQGWQLRHSPGVANRRANSVLPIPGSDAKEISELIKAVEEFYQSRNLASRFMISPAALPENLDDELERLGYVIDAPTLVQWGRVDEIWALCGEDSTAELIDAPDAGWMSVYMEGIEDEQEIALKTGLLQRIEADHALAQVVEDGRPVGVGLSVFENGWAGIFCMSTLQPNRRQGIARQVLRHLVLWAQKKGAQNMYLQVECDNPSAQNFYQSSGFMTQYGYHYRTKESRRASQ